jgi:hypothetical protein
MLQINSITYLKYFRTALNLRKNIVRFQAELISSNDKKVYSIK